MKEIKKKRKTSQQRKLQTRCTNQTFNKELTSILSNSFKNRRGGKFPNSFYETDISLMTEPDKDTTKKESDRPISLMNIDVKIPQ